MKLLKRTWADVSLDNLAHNYTVLRQQVPAACRFLGVVKADAYGHGAVPVSHHLEELGAEFLAVSNLEEAVQLRRGEVRSPILILGYTPAQYARDLAEMDLRQEVHSLAYARELEARLVGTDSRLQVHLKLDTGMARLGFFCQEGERVLEELLTVTRRWRACSPTSQWPIPWTRRMRPSPGSNSGCSSGLWPVWRLPVCDRRSATAATAGPPLPIRNSPWIWYVQAWPPTASLPLRTWRDGWTCGLF